MPVSELGGFTRDQVMPPQPLTVMLYANRVVFLTFSYLGQFLYYCFIGAIILGVGRLLMLCGLALVEPAAQASPSRRSATTAPPSRC